MSTASASCCYEAATLQQADDQDTCSRSTTAGASSRTPSSDAVGDASMARAWLSVVAGEVRAMPWDSGRFAMVGKLQDAPRNFGHVSSMRDKRTGCLVAVKEMPNSWMCDNHEAFIKRHCHETEQPWVDVACMAFLHSAQYPYSCGLLGAFQDESVTRVVSELASEGDLFSWCATSAKVAMPGRERELYVRPLVAQVFDAVRWLHDLSIVHSDISMENILVTQEVRTGGLQVKLIDFASATARRYLRERTIGKPAYQAPEVSTDIEYDGFLADTFATGVVMYCMLLIAYPWSSTGAGGACVSFRYFRKHGFRKFALKRKLTNGKSAIEVLTPAATALVEELTAMDPAMRTTLGERTWLGECARPSVWGTAWMRYRPSTADAPSAQ